MKIYSPDVLPEYIWQYLAAVQAAAVAHPAYLAGGAVRNAVHNRKPRDLDVYVLYGKSGWRGRTACTRRFLFQHFGTVRTYRMYPDYPDKVDERNFAVDKFEFADGLALDLIATTAETIDELLSRFDFNLNQYVAWLDPPYGRHVQFRGRREGELVQLNRVDQENPDRAHYIREKARGFGWAVT